MCCRENLNSVSEWYIRYCKKIFAVGSDFFRFLVGFFRCWVGFFSLLGWILFRCWVGFFSLLSPMFFRCWFRFFPVKLDFGFFRLCLDFFAVGLEFMRYWVGFLPLSWIFFSNEWIGFSFTFICNKKYIVFISFRSMIWNETIYNGVKSTFIYQVYRVTSSRSYNIDDTMYMYYIT